MVFPEMEKLSHTDNKILLILYIHVNSPYRRVRRTFFSQVALHRAY